MDESMSKILHGRPIPFDMDSTLCFDESDLTPEQRDGLVPTPVYCFGRVINVYPHPQNVALAKKLYNRGYTLLGHSKTGPEWAEAVCVALKIDQYFTQYQWKPEFYVDDLPVANWYGERIYKDYEP
jgi:hypothetical protein